MIPKSPPLVFPLATAEQIGAMLGGVPSKTVHRYAREDRLPSILIGKHRRFCSGQVAATVRAAAARGEAI